MRAEGLDVPDPPPGERGFGFARSSDPADDEAFERARNDCRKKLVGTSEIFEEDKATLNDKVVQWAGCMRTEGIDIADPVFTATYGKGQFFREVENPTDPVWNKADDQCRTKIFGGPDQGPGGERTQGGDDPN
jgi:hypothetical protein